MVSLRADAFGRFVIERRYLSIGTLFLSSQCKRVSPTVFGLILGLACFSSGAAGAQELSPRPLPPPPAPAGFPPVSSDPAMLPQAPLPRVNLIPVIASTPADPREIPAAAAVRDLDPLRPAPLGGHSHDGFYLRVALGLGVGGALVSSDSKSIGDYTFGGGSGAWDVWLGGTPSPGLAMGAAITGLGLNSGNRRQDGNPVAGEVSAALGLLGYFVDVFPDPERGFHFGGALGLASGSAEVNTNESLYATKKLNLIKTLFIKLQWNLRDTSML